MKRFNVQFFNKETGEMKKENIERITFQEAIQFAYKTSTCLGFDWEIISVSKK